MELVVSKLGTADPAVVGYTLLALISATATWIALHRRSGLPPGPTRIPLVYDGIWASKRQGPGYGRRMFAKYGPTFTDTLLGRRVIFISRLEDVQKVLDGENDLVSAEHSGSASLLLGPHALSTSRGHLHTLLREHLRSLFSPRAMRGYLPQMQLIIEQAVEKWVSQGDIKGANEAVALSFQVMAEVVMGLDLWQQPAVGHRLSAAWQDYCRGMAASPLRWPGSASDKALQARRVLQEALAAVIEEQRARAGRCAQQAEQHRRDLALVAQVLRAAEAEVAAAGLQQAGHVPWLREGQQEQQEQEQQQEQGQQEEDAEQQQRDQGQELQQDQQQGWPQQQEQQAEQQGHRKHAAAKGQERCHDDSSDLRSSDQLTKRGCATAGQAAAAAAAAPAAGTASETSASPYEDSTSSTSTSTSSVPAAAVQDTCSSQHDPSDASRHPCASAEGKDAAAGQSPAGATAGQIAEATVDERAGAPAGRSSGSGGQAVCGATALAVLLSLRNEQGRPLPDEQLQDILLNLAWAGHGTSATALTRALWLLPQHPAVLARLRAEQQAVVAQHGEAITEAVLRESTYLDAVVKELLRHQAVVGSVHRRALQDFTLGPYHIRRGDRLQLSLAQLMENDPRWAYLPASSPLAVAKFAPERWLEGGGAEGRTGGWLPFGAGARMCLGCPLALAEIKLVLALLARRATWQVSDPGEAWDEFPLAVPRKGLPIRVEAL